MLVLVAAALTFAGWAYSQRTKPGTAIGDAATLRGPDIDLLSVVAGTGYHRANCAHGSSDQAVLSCDPNPATSAPEAHFFRFRTANALHDYYNTAFLGVMGATSCPSDPPGKDGASMDDGKEIGRKACYTDRTTSAAGNPALVITDESDLAMAAYIWDGADKTALRDYHEKGNLGQFRSQENAHDPDDFTEGDRSLLGHLNAPYIDTNCRHGNPPVGPATAILDCDTKIDDPGVSFVGFPNSGTTKTVYQADLGQFPGHACGGGGADDVWRQQSTPIGRFFCYTDKTDDPARDVLVAVYEDLHLFVVVTGSTAEYPGNSPKNNAALFAWFQQHFTT
ncbi:hypothetical protein ACFXPS_28165 [Nocardia sp. NPDC059091]|uniref:hypothetical protein n=1 Tax=Nocardia sp. NPDC059091 TaxID=3346724 RepID=UPI0036C81032